jgi:hypothetical protein
VCGSTLGADTLPCEPAFRQRDCPGLGERRISGASDQSCRDLSRSDGAGEGRYTCDSPRSKLRSAGRRQAEFRRSSGSGERVRRDDLPSHLQGLVGCPGRGLRVWPRGCDSGHVSIVSASAKSGEAKQQFDPYVGRQSGRCLELVVNLSMNRNAITSEF